MKIDGLSDKASRFEGANHSLTLQDSPGVMIRAVELDGWLRIMIELRDDTTHDQIRDAIPLALRWRDRLVEWQGHWTSGGDQGLLEMMHQKQRLGMLSHAQIAEKLNQQIADHLIEHKGWQEEYFALKDDFKTMGDFYLHKWTYNQFAAEHAKGILETMRFPDSEIEAILSEGFGRIMNGEPPFEQEYPISRDKVINILRVWRRNRSVPDDEDPMD